MPVSPPSRHAAKKPSTFSLMPPTAWMSPCWSTEPVTADVLAERNPRERRDEREELGAGRGVALNGAVGLLEDKAHMEPERALAGVAVAQEAGGISTPFV